MAEYTKAEAMAFIDALRLTVANRTGFQWFVGRLAELSTYIDSITAENEQLNEYIDWAGDREAYDSYRAAQPSADRAVNAPEDSEQA